MTTPNQVTLLDASGNFVATYSTIQDAVDNAQNGYTVEVGPGTYQEQVTVNGLTNLTIEGSGQGSTTILSPDEANLVSNINNPGEQHTSTDALVGLENGASVTIKNLTANGNNQGVVYALGANGGGDLVGIEAVSSGLTVNNVHVTGVEDVENGTLQGGQGNKAIIVNNTDGAARTTTITSSTIDNFQKAGVLLEGAGLTLNVSGNTLTGVGTAPTNLSQNLIEIDFGATGSITNNIVTGVSDADFGSAGVFAFQPGSGLTVSGNAIAGEAGNVNSAGIYLLNADAAVAENNTLTDQGFALTEDGENDPPGTFTTPLLQSGNIYNSDGINYTFLAAPNSTSNWMVTGTGGPDDLQGGAGNDVFTITGGGANGNTFVGNAGINTAQGYGAGNQVAVQNNQWVVTKGSATDTLSGIEKVVINGTTFDLVDQFGANTGGFQSIQAAVNAANSGDVIVADTGASTQNVQDTVNNLTFKSSSNATGITLNLGSGVQDVTLADYTPGAGPAVTAVANSLPDTFRGTMADLNGDTIDNLQPGDKIAITDANPSTFTYNLSGSTLSYGSDSINLGIAAPGHFVETADPAGGVDLTYVLPPTSAALVQESNGALDYLEFSGTNLTASDLVAPYTSWPIRAEGDFNGAGPADLVAQDPATGAIDLLFLQNGALKASQLEQGDYWKAVGAGDFDGSGRTGIATQNVATGQIDLLWFTGTQLSASDLLSGSYQPVVGTADFNGDGKTDFVTQPNGGGPLDFLFFNNSTLSSSYQTPQSFEPVHEAVNTGVPGQSVLLSKGPPSGQIDYLGFNGTTFVSSQLELANLTGARALPGTEVAAELFSQVG